MVTLIGGIPIDDLDTVSLDFLGVDQDLDLQKAAAILWLTHLYFRISEFEH
jgi:hypothetical protein